MLPRNSKHIFYSVLLIVGSIIGRSVMANTMVHGFDSDVASAVKEINTSSSVHQILAGDIIKYPSKTSSSRQSSTEKEISSMMFTTIINGANEEVVCTNDGSTLAKFFLCGTGDNRTVTVNGSGTITWQKQLASCPLVGGDSCPVKDNSCYGPAITGASYFLDASDPSVAGEYRVRIDSGVFYYFRVSSNPLNPQLSTQDIVCGTPGRVEVTNVPSGYEYSLNSASGPFQDNPYFDITAEGNYQVFTRLKNASQSACVFPSQIVSINEVDMTVEVSKVDISCSGEKGSITIDISGVPGFYSYKLIRNGTTMNSFGPNSSNTHTFNNLGAGTYSVAVQAGSSCADSISTINGDPITIGAGLVPVDATAFATDSFGCGATSVAITLNASGGTAPYQFSVNGGVFEGSFSSGTTHTVNNPGTYNIVVRDANGCSKNTVVDVENIPPPVYNISSMDANCGGANNGSITVNVTNSNGYNLEYSINNGASFRNSNVFSNLAPATYDVVVRYQQDTFSCNTPAISRSIGAPSIITATASDTEIPSCANQNGGEITFSGVSGGVGPYEYSIGSGFILGTTVFSGLSTGTYSPQIRDANGCVETLPAIVFDPIDKPTDIDFTIMAIDCATSTASVSLTVTGGESISDYKIISPITVHNGPNNSFTGLALGSYTFRVTDAEGCSYTESFAITEISSIGVSSQVVRNNSCIGESDGEGRFIVDGFSSSYSYQIDGNSMGTGQTSNVIPLSGLPAGSYTLTVTDEVTSCSESGILTIAEPSAPLTIAPLWTDMSCQNNNRGSVNANASGGWGGYNYTLTRPNGSTVGPRSNPNFSGLTDDSGLYTIAVVDGGGCIASASYNFTALTAPTLLLDIAASDFCFDSTDGTTLEVNASGGDGNYEYRINNGTWVPGGMSASFGNLGPGNHKIEVRDGNNCIGSITRYIRPQTTSRISIQKGLTCSLTGAGDAEISVTLSNGNPPYNTYEMSYNGAAYTGPTAIYGSSFVYTTANPGTYQFRVTDNFGCMVETNIVTIDPTATIVANATVTNPRCDDPTTGVVELVPDTSVGIPPFQYSIDNSPGSFTNQNVYGNLSPGNYTYYVRDSRGCWVDVDFTVGPPTAGIDASVVMNAASCSSGVVLGSIDVDGNTNGVGPYTYTLLSSSGSVTSMVGPTPSDTASFTNLPTGRYTVITRDAAGCEDRDVVTLTASGLSIAPIPPPVPVSCDATGFTYSVSVSGGSGTYEIRLLGEPSYYPLNPGGGTHTFSNALNGIIYGVAYTVEVHDMVTNCIYFREIPPVDEPNSLVVTASGTTASCEVAGNGVFSYEVIDYTGTQLEISVINSSTGAFISPPSTITVPAYTGDPYADQITSLPPGSYQVLVEDLNSNCTSSAQGVIIQDIPTISVDRNTNANCNNPNGQLIVRGVGGTAPYLFSVVPSTTLVGVFTSATTYDLPPGDYDIYVQDANSCESISSQTISMSPGVPTPTVDVTNQCTAVSSYIVEVTSPLSSGTSPETTFQYDMGGGFQSSPTFTMPNPGTYTIIVRDGNGCTNTVEAAVFDFFSITASATAEPSCNNSDGIITVETSGGSGNFNYVLDDGAGLVVDQDNDPVFSGLLPGNYSITVTDRSSNTVPLCQDTATVNIITVLQPVIDTLSTTDISCFGSVDGSITVDLVSATATDGPFTYNLYDSTNTLVRSQADAILDNLSADTYEVEVVSNRGCVSLRLGATIAEPTELMGKAYALPFSCNLATNTFNTTSLFIYTDSNGDGSGSLTGTAPYTFSINDGTAVFDGTNFQSSNVFEIIDNGRPQLITVTIRDANGCEVIDTINLTPPDGLTFSFNEISSIGCDASGTGVVPGTVEIVIDQGSGNYGVEILPLGSQPERMTGGADRIVWDIDTPGDYIFAVRDIDNGGCLYVTTIHTVPDYNLLVADINEIKPVTCFGGSDGEISIAINNYVGKYEYEVFSRDLAGVETSTGVMGSFDTENPINTPEIITGVPAGNLVVRILELDSPYCTVISNVTTVHGPNRVLDIIPVQTAAVTCFIPGRGEITVSGDGGWGGYQYQLEQETAVLGSFSTVIPFSLTNVFGDLSNGNYRLSIVDMQGCVVTEEFSLNLPMQIAADIRIVQPLLCPGSNDGIIEAYNVSGGQDLNGDGEEYLYQLNRLDSAGAILNTSGLQESIRFYNLPSGRFNINVFDGWGCSFTTQEIIIQDPLAVDPDLVETLSPGCEDEGRMELSVTNPMAGMEYFYRRSGTSDPFVSFGGTNINKVEIIIPDVNANPGPYQYEVQNGNGCPIQLSNEINLDRALPLVIALDLVDANIKCSGEATGIIRSEAFGGVGNYNYILVNNNLDSGAPGVPRMPMSSDIIRNSQTSGVFRNLDAGSYYVYVTSATCSAISQEIVVSPKEALILERLEAVPVSCSGDLDGQIRIEASGGSGQIRFSISETLSEFFEGNDPLNQNAITFRDLPPGSYEIIVQDELGCSILQEVVITVPEELMVTNVSATPETCLLASDGSAQLSMTGGTPFVDLGGFGFYETKLIGPDATGDEVFYRNDRLVFDHLKGGETYVVFIRDAKGCETNVIVPITMGVELKAEAQVAYGCEGIFPNNTTSILLADPSVETRLLFSLNVDDLSQANTQTAFGNLHPGEHTVYIYHENGCSSFVTFTIDPYEPLTLTAIKTGPDQITAKAVGGFGEYEYFFQGKATGSDTVFYAMEDSNITVSVRDQMGCSATITIPFDFTGRIEAPNFFTPNGDHKNDEWVPGNSSYFPNLKVKIYDRYGRVVAILDNVSGWDGTYRGTEMPSGDYWYEVNTHDKENHQYIGHFTLYR
ncbi:gliding motility-associated C-terminal domain-containing protein [Arenibacter nanhaiticus]|uniref:Gliding motility-associated C-terminal domain-containing protein n=1 Tax=Arenibacter nanhaiticus TaxID=558155 RepID=A0A1M6J5S8_9FLAO|nr:T9SS type B sorting domain-containing protein [Arenibacter nanhaiticus]SHJ42056.1 gliding motility-associated C-terminal domain-containing protein [Arenibacter nanhaiticus]